MKHFWQCTIPALLLISCLVISSSAPVSAAELPPVLNTTNNPHTSIQNTDQLLLYANAQNLVDHWNNLVIRAKTGEQQLQMTRDEGRSFIDSAYLRLIRFDTAGAY